MTEMKDKIKGMWNEAAGEVKERTGRLINNQKMEQEGHDQEMKGKAQQAVADAKKAVKDAAENARKGI